MEKVWYYGKKYGTLGKKYGTILKSMKFRSTKENTWYIIKTSETLSNTGKKYVVYQNKLSFWKIYSFRTLNYGTMEKNYGTRVNYS